MLIGPWDITAVVLAAFGFAAVCQAAGASLFAVLWRGQVGGSEQRVRRLGVLTACLGIGAVALRTVLEPAHLSGTAAGVTNPSLQMMVLTSEIGAAAGLRLAGFVLIAAGLGRNRRGGDLAAIIGATVCCLSYTLTGHTAASPARPLLLPLLTAHLLLASFWFGALVPLRIVLRRESTAIAGAALADYSRLAVWLVPAIALAGGLMLCGLADPLAAVPASGWGRLALLKLALFTALMGFAALNKQCLVPRLAAGDASAARALRTSIACEIALILLVFAATAVMTGFFAPPGAETAG